MDKLDRTRRKHIAIMEVDIEKSDGCWNWTGRMNEHGYGLTGIRGKSTLAHRTYWEFIKGPIPAGLCVLHSCDNRKCVNPDHLRVGTHAENMKDASIRNRFPSRSGSLNPNTKLDIEKVNEIRADKTSTHVALAKKYGVTDVSIRNIRVGKTWA